ncbi:uncharacterized protein G6M90_00g029170 [Metarhizium brunneum]|uniref:Uncharacterized protein n=1 Tax=Metarhizium brunneum TaxID=500148 RepID=A0A7D5YYQ0_9HYPO
MSLVLTNGAVAQTTKTLPPDEPFGQGGNPDWLRQIYQQLHVVYGLPPKLRVYRTTVTSPSKDLEDLSSHFQHWRQNPESFWETPSTAVQLDSQTTELRVLQRFVAVSAHELFLRIVPRARERISAKQMADFLIAIGLQAPSEDRKKYAGLVRRGRDWVLFCSRLHEIESHNMQSPPPSPSVCAAGDTLHAASFDSPGIYGPLFVCSIDDSIFGSNGLFGSGKQQYIKQLSEAGLSKAAREYGANQTAKILLGYHQNLFWLPSTTLEGLDSLIVRKRKPEIECGNTKKKPRNDSESETNLRCDNMVSPQLQGHQPTSLTRLDGIDVLTPLACSPDWSIDATSPLPLFRIEDFFYIAMP